MLCHCLPAETRPRDSSSYQAVWAEQVRPLWLPRGITSRDRALSLTGFTPASRALALLTTEREVRPEEAEVGICPDSLSASRAKNQSSLNWITSHFTAQQIKPNSLLSFTFSACVLCSKYTQLREQHVCVCAPARSHVLNSHEGAALCSTKKGILPARGKCVGFSIMKTRLL